MAANKVVYGGNTLIDLTSDTVSTNTLADGVTAHNAAGVSITGTGSLGAVRYDTAQTLTDAQKVQARENIGALVPEKVTLSGAVNITAADNKEYSMTGVTSLTMRGAAVCCHGFVTFGSSAPTINVTGFAGASGDDITGAAAGQVWEFSIFAHNGGAYIIWKNWSA